MTDTRPAVDDRAPADAIDEMVAHVLRLAASWVAWDGQPVQAADRVYTPHKAVRRVADHMVDHLAQLEAHVAGVASLPDHWGASSITTPADLAPFTVADFGEARSRLERLAAVWRIRLEALDEQQLDFAIGPAYSPRELAFHTVESTYYADAVGDLGGSGQLPESDEPSCGSAA